MKRLFFVLMFGFLFAQVPDSTIVAKMAVIEGEFKKNAEIIVKYQERQKFLEGSYNALNELLKEKDEVEE